MIISLGYRVKSVIATHFRRWATERLREYIIKGFALDDERLKQLGGGNYWKELLNPSNKNYLKEDELKVLNNLVSGYFDFAEIQAMRHNPMYMLDYVKQLDNILSSTDGALLTDAGKVSHAQAMKKAEEEYRKYEVRTLSPVEAAYLDTIKKLGNETKRKKME